jgi:pilus assembly protein CpaC
MVAMRTNRRVWLYIVSTFFLLLVNTLVAQDVYIPPPTPPASATASPASMPEVTPFTAGMKSGGTPTPWAFSKLPNSKTGGQAPAPSPGQAPAPPSTPQSNGASQMLHLVVGRSLYLTTASRLRRIYVSNPVVLDSLTASPHELVISAKAAGTSSVAVWNEAGESTFYTVSADVDVAGLRDALTEALPGCQIEVESRQGRVFLSGVVGADAEAEAAGKLASVYSKDLINSIVVDPRHRPQVQLKIEIAEVDRTKLDAFGINIFSLGKNTSLSTTGQFSAPTFPVVGSGIGQATATLSDVLNLFYFNTDLNVGVTLKDLQNKGVLEILAEPTLVTIQGQPAKFLAGGEFPYPVVQPSGGGGVTSVTIQFRQYGVKLDFTPFVNPDGTIRLKMQPEVSALDYTNQVVIAGYTLPAISTRKAETEIELRDGQSFGISGLLDHRTTEQLSKIPGIGDIPILGQLFRSRNLNHSVMELIVIATPTIVDPLNGPMKPPAQPNWVTPPGQLPNFDHGLPK